MNIQGSNISGSYNSTSKQDTVVKKSEDRAQGQRTLSNNVKITNTKSSTKKRIDDNFGQSKYVTYSENLKRQSKSFSAAAGNASDGASLIQTATDALNETEAILNRMKEISDQAVESSLSSNDRQVLQQELDSLSASINDISKNTNANGINIFDGDGSTKVYKAPPAYESLDQVIIKQEHMAEVFETNGNTFYKENSTEALSDADAKKELQNGNSLYMEAASNQSAFDYEKWKEDNATVTGPTHIDSVSSSDPHKYDIVSLDSEMFTFHKLTLGIKKNVNGSYSSDSIAPGDIKVNGSSLSSSTQVTAEQLAEGLNQNSKFNQYFTAEVITDSNNQKSLLLTSKDTDKAYVQKFYFDKTGPANTTSTNTLPDASSNAGASTPAAPLPDLYALGGSEKLDSEDAKKRLENGEQLYTNAHQAQQKAENNKDYTYTPAKTVLREEVTPGKPSTDKDSLIPSYKTLNFQINSEGSKYVSARIDMMDADAIGVSNLSIKNIKEAELTGSRIDEAKTQVKNQREYLSSIGGRLKEAATVNDKNAGYVKDAQKQDAAKNPVTVEPKEDIYAALQQTVLENANKASEDAINLIGSTEIAQPTKE